MGSGVREGVGTCGVIECHFPVCPRLTAGLGRSPLILVPMKPRITTSVSRKRFWAALITSLRIYHPAREWMRHSYESFDQTAYQPRVAQKVVGLAFLNAVSAWEQFVEHVFLGYMAGAASETGFAPKLLLGPCQNRSHALRVLGAAGGGDPQRLLRWNDWSWVVHVAAAFFRGGEPFSRLDSVTVARLRDAQVIRNRVAHDSAKARSQFKRCVNALGGDNPKRPLPRGFSPGELLATTTPPMCFPTFKVWPAENHAWGDFFESFVSMFFEASSVLSPTTDSAEP